MTCTSSILWRLEAYLPQSPVGTAFCSISRCGVSKTLPLVLLTAAHATPSPTFPHMRAVAGCARRTHLPFSHLQAGNRRERTSRQPGSCVCVVLHCAHAPAGRPDGPLAGRRDACAATPRTPQHNKHLRFGRHLRPPLAEKQHHDAAALASFPLPGPSPAAHPPPHPTHCLPHPTRTHSHCTRPTARATHPQRAFQAGRQDGQVQFS